MRNAFSREQDERRAGRGRQLTIILSSLMAIVTDVVRRCWGVPTG